MKNATIKEGMVVRYANGWCSEEERKYVHVVKENRMSPITGEMTRWLIETLNIGNAPLCPTEEVEDYMIEPTGLTVEDLIS